MFSIKFFSPENFQKNNSLQYRFLLYMVGLLKMDGKNGDDFDKILIKRRKI